MYLSLYFIVVIIIVSVIVLCATWFFQLCCISFRFMQMIREGVSSLYSYVSSIKHNLALIRCNMSDLDIIAL